MDKHTAIKKAHKIIGKGFGYRENHKAGTKDDREKAKAELKIANAERQRLKEAMEARRLEILKADQEYQKRRAAYKEAEKLVQKLSAASYGHRITVGYSNSSVGGFSFFHVKAEGDNWEEVLEKLSK